MSYAHIASVYDFGEQTGVDYIVMECVPGESLAAKIKSGQLILETPHDVTEQRPQLVKAVLDWLDHYLGRVE